MNKKFDIQNENLEWYKKRSIYAKWAIKIVWMHQQQRILSKIMEITQLELNLIHSL